MRALLVGLLTAALAVAGTVAHPAAAQGLPIELRLTLDRGAYESGSPIGFTVAARNVMREPLTLTFATTQRIDVVIRKESVVVSRYASSLPSLPGFGTQRWEPGETVVFPGSWLPITLVAPSGLPGAVPQPLAPSMYSISAELLSTGVRIPSPSQPLIIGRPVPVGPGCTTVSTTFGMALPAATVAGVLNPPAALRGLWRLDPTLNRYLGYLPDAGAPRDLITVPAGETVLFCTSTAAYALMPDP